MDNPLFAELHPGFSEIATAMNRCHHQATGGTFNWDVIKNPEIGAGPVGVARLMKSWRQHLDILPGHGVNLQEFDQIIAKWDRAVQVDELEPESYEEDWRWMMNLGRGYP